MGILRTLMLIDHNRNGCKVLHCSKGACGSNNIFTYINTSKCILSQRVTLENTKSVIKRWTSKLQKKRNSEEKKMKTKRKDVCNSAGQRMNISKSV